MKLRSADVGNLIEFETFIGKIELVLNLELYFGSLIRVLYLESILLGCQTAFVDKILLTVSNFGKFIEQIRATKLTLKISLKKTSVIFLKFYQLQVAVVSF